MNHLTDSQLNEYLDGTLDALTKRHCDKHLADCASCRARLAELQSLFAELSALPEARLPHDLTAPVLAGLRKPPRRWTPAFAAQLGAALGVFIWLATQLARLIPSISAFRHQGLTIPTFQPSIPDFEIPDPHSLLTIFYSLFSLPAFHPSSFLPHLSPIHLPTFQLSSLNLAFISVSVSVLWIIGNAALLRVGKEVKS